MSKKISVGLASYGMSGNVFHAPLLHSHKEFEINKVWERTSSNSIKRYPYVTIVRSFNELINDSDIELIIVNTPDDTHYPLAKQALLAGKHVVVEKPFTLNISKGKELIEIAKKEKKILSVYQNRRWDGGFLTVKNVIDNKLIGRLVEYESHYNRFRNYLRDTWKEDPSVGTSIIYNLGSHMIDQALVLFGIPNYVYADIRKNRDNAQVDDYFAVNMGYDNIKVEIRGSYLVKEPGPQYTLHGTEGSFVKFGSDPQEDALIAGEYPDKEGFGIEKEETWGILNNEDGRKKVKTKTGSYISYYQNIYEAIRLGKELAVPAEQSLNVIRIIDYAKQSNKEGKRIKVNI